MSVLSVPSVTLLVDHVVDSADALLSGQPALPILRDLNRSFNGFPQSEIRQPLRTLMGQVRLGNEESGGGIPTAQMAQAMIGVGRSLQPLVEARDQDRLQSVIERLNTLALVGGTVTPISGVFRRKDVMDRDAKDALVKRQLSVAKLTAAGGAIHDAVNTLTFLQGPQILMKRHAKALCALEVEFAEITPIGSVKGRLDFVEAALDPVAEMSKRIDGILTGIGEVRNRMQEASGDYEEAERVVQELIRRGGKIDEVRKNLQKLRTEIAELLLKLHRADLQRWVDLGLIADETRQIYVGRLAGLRSQLEAARDFMELGRKILEKFSKKIGDISSQQNCPFPVDIAEHLEAEFLQSVLGSAFKLDLNVDAPLWKVPGPSESVWQVIVNLVKNAKQAMKDGGRLRISVLPVTLTDVEVARRSHDFTAGTPRPGDYMMMTVRDSGHGIPQDALPRIFDLFYSNNHSGYGLAATRQIVEEYMGGFIGVDSSTSDDPVGTVFYIYFPRAS